MTSLDNPAEEFRDNCGFGLLVSLELCAATCEKHDLQVQTIRQRLG